MTDHSCDNGWVWHEGEGHYDHDYEGDVPGVRHQEPCRVCHPDVKDRREMMYQRTIAVHGFKDVDGRLVRVAA